MNKLYIAMYHYTRDLKNSRYPKIHGLDYSLFKKQLSFFEETMHVVTMEEVLAAIHGKAELPNNAVLLTFDDGYIDNYTFALPALKEHHMQGSFFIPAKTFVENKLLDVNKIHFILASADEKQLKETLLQKLNLYRGAEYSYPSNEELLKKYEVANRFDIKETIFIKRILQTVLPEELRNQITSELFAEYVAIPEDQFARELYMNPDQIQLMKDNGMFIGIHGYDHYWLGNLSIEQMHNDIDKALISMKPFVNSDNWVMNYPYGSYNDEVISYIQSKGASLALTTEVRIADITKDDSYKLPRLDTNDFPPKSENYKTME